MQISIEDCRKDLLSDYYRFFRFFWPLISSAEFVDAPHIRLICNELNQLGWYIINKEKPPYDWYIINIPPGTSKSSMVTVLWPVWLLSHNDGIFILNSSYSKGLSERDVRRSKAVLTSLAYQTFFRPLNYVKDTESYFETDKSGGRYATSTGGTIVGYHGNVNIHDDPLSVEMSYSPADRARANRFVVETMSQRVRVKGSTPQVIVMQRLHEEDPTGHIISKGLNVKHIVLPDIVNDKCTHPEIYTNGLLDPKRLSLQVIEEERKKLGEVAYACQYTQDPNSKDGLLYSEFQTYETLPPTFGAGNYTDTADSGDDYLCSVCYEKGKDKIYITDVLFTQEPMEVTENLVPMLLTRNNTRYANVESNAGGRYFAVKIKTKLPRVKVDWFYQSKNKESRILTNAATVNETIVMPLDWKERWPVFARHITMYKRLYHANKHHDGADVLTGIVEKEFFGKAGKLRRMG